MQLREDSILRFLHDEDKAIVERIDFSLIFHAILIEAFVAVTDRRIWPIGCLGLVASYLWMMTGIRQYLNYRMIVRDLHGIPRHEVKSEDVKYVLEMTDKRYDEKRADRLNPLVAWAAAVPQFTVVIPIACFVTWVWMILTAPAMPVIWQKALLVVIGPSLVTILTMRLKSAQKLEPVSQRTSSDLDQPHT